MNGKKTGKKSGVYVCDANINSSKISSFYILAVFTSRFSIMKKHCFRISKMSTYFVLYCTVFHTWHSMGLWTLKSCFWSSVLLIDPPLRMVISYHPVVRQSLQVAHLLDISACHTSVLSSPEVTYWAASGTSPDPELSVFLGKTKRLFRLQTHSKRWVTTFGLLDAIREVTTFNLDRDFWKIRSFYTDSNKMSSYE